MHHLHAFLPFLLINVLTLPASGAGKEAPVIDESTILATVDDLVAEHRGPARARAQAGVRQAAMLWRAEDGDAEAFRALCREHFVPEGPALDALLARFDGSLEALNGYQVALLRQLREPVDLERGDRLPVDSLLATLNPFDHLLDDLYATRVAFVILLNFPAVPLETLDGWEPRGDRKAWAAARLARVVALRIPGEILQAQTAAFSAAEEYIAAYNLRMDRILDGAGRRPFPEGTRLISHWGLRDELKALYSDPRGNLERQELIYRIMLRIIRQEIPAAVIDNPEMDWEPVGNVAGPHSPGGGVPDFDLLGPWEREPDTRYRHLLATFRAVRAVDPHAAAWPTFIDRRFDLGRELSEARVRGLLEAVTRAPVARKVARLVRTRLDRDLQPFDIWFDGFKNRAAIPEEELTRRVREAYPDLAAFQAGIPALLERLGFEPDTAAFLASKIVVDPARGAGHAMGAGMRSDAAHLRTRVPPDGMDYKGYNIAIHELGHNVEQVLSLNRVDHVLLAGVPNTAFTEAFAFLFQARDLELLGLAASGRSPEEEALQVLDRFWSTMEIASVGLVDMGVWRWMYEHPEASPAELREAVIAIAVEVWNDSWGPVLGVPDSPILAIYSHMISAGLYLPDYALGYLVQHQVEDAIRGRALGVEMERMVTQGALTPDAWMRGAVGAPLSAQP
ncbi:MAG: hypothetical protein FJ098_13170, partial [Deltaproteobacteria bacterium]|nr:hypothetical protein [Deltaproteobacteria bacterium]